MSTRQIKSLMSVVMLGTAMVAQAANLIQNSSFEDAASQTLFTGAGKDLGSELGWGTATDPQTISGCGVSNWTGGGRVWYVAATNTTRTPIAVFPDGEWGARVDGSAKTWETPGKKFDVLAQVGLNLVAGTTYNLTFDVWGEGNTDANFDVRFTHGFSDILDYQSGTGVTVLDEKTTDCNNGAAETVMVLFTPTVTAAYGLQFFNDIPAFDDTVNIDEPHFWIDNVELDVLSHEFEIQNGSFENNTATPGAGYVAGYSNNELGATPEQFSDVDTYGVTGWDSTSRIWLYHDRGGDNEANFPDGSFAAAIDASFVNGGIDVLAYINLLLVAGNRYELTFDLWGPNSPSIEPLDVRFTHSFSNALNPVDGTGTTVLDEKTTVGNDVAYETVSVIFTPTVTALYALQFFMDNSEGASTQFAYIDNVQITWLPPPRGTVITFR